MASRRYGRLLGILPLFVIAFFLSLTRTSIGMDESWMLQVVSRMGAGEVLYRDVFCGTMPLAFYFALAATKLLGVELYALKLVVILSWLLSLLCALAIVRRIAGTSRYQAVLIPSMLLYALPTEMALYQPLANLFMLAAFLAILHWLEARLCNDDESGFATESQRHREFRSSFWLKAPSSNAEAVSGFLCASVPLWPTLSSKGRNAGRGEYGALALAGVFAGCGLATKQNIGVYILAAILSALVCTRVADSHPRSTIGACLVPVIPFVIIAGLVLAWIAMSGGWNQFLDYGFINKRRYLAVAGISYFDGLNELLAARFERRLISFGESLNNRLVFLAPLLSVAGLLAMVLMRRAKLERRETVLLIFTIAALLSLYPRVDLLHVTVVAPGLFIAIVCAWHRVREAAPSIFRWSLEAGVIALLCAGLAVKVLAVSRSLTWRTYAWSDLPHYRFLYLPAAEIAMLRNDAMMLKAETARGPVFLLFPDASRSYLVGGIPNPTPFDYPLLTAFGVKGEAHTIAALSEKRIRAVCLRKHDWNMAPGRLESFVEENLQAERFLGSCRLYRVRE